MFHVVVANVIILWYSNMYVKCVCVVDCLPGFLYNALFFE